jgi:branched-chain amino acid transport system ATP-binding protein
LLKVENINAFYGDMQALYDVSLEVKQGEIVAVLGANAAGKSTTIKTISGLIQKWSGSISFEGKPINTVPAHKRVELGLVQVPEGRQLFPFMSVQENLELGAYTKEARKEKNSSMKKVFEMFPKLYERRHQLAGSLSGGEQQMCAIGRGLMAKPKFIMLDEPTLGLAPIIVKQIFSFVEEIRRQGVTVLLVEQNLHQSLKVADRAYVLENGKIALTGTGKELLEDKALFKAYLGK